MRLISENSYKKIVLCLAGGMHDYIALREPDGYRFNRAVGITEVATVESYIYQSFHVATTT